MLRFGFVWRVQVDLWAAHFIGVQHAEWGSVDVDSNEILAADFRISQLVDIRNARSGYIARWTLAATLVTQAAVLLVGKDAFP